MIFEGLIGAALIYMYIKGYIIVFDNPLNFASIVLTGAAVVLAAATIFIGLLGLWGVHDFREKAEDAARKEADKYVKSKEFESKVYRATQDFLRYDREAGVGSDQDIDAMAQHLMTDGQEPPRNGQ